MPCLRSPFSSPLSLSSSSLNLVLGIIPFLTDGGASVLSPGVPVRASVTVLARVGGRYSCERLSSVFPCVLTSPAPSTVTRSSLFAELEQNQPRAEGEPFEFSGLSCF